MGPPSEKVTTHSYQILYGIFLSYTKAWQAKLFQVGRDCGSMSLWQAVLPQAHLWQAAYDDACAEQVPKKGTVGLVTGRSLDRALIETWVSKTGGNFGLVIDDGGHS